MKFMADKNQPKEAALSLGQQKYTQHKRMLVQAAETEFMSYVLTGDPELIQAARGRWLGTFKSMMEAVEAEMHAAIAELSAPKS